MAFRRLRPSFSTIIDAPGPPHPDFRLRFAKRKSGKSDLPHKGGGGGGAASQRDVAIVSHQLTPRSPYCTGFHAGFGAAGSCAPAIDVGARP